MVAALALAVDSYIENMPKDPSKSFQPSVRKASAASEALPRANTASVAWGEAPNSRLMASR